FARLLDILDRELHIITPTEVEHDNEATVPSVPCYQLTHDYLVPSLRQWLSQERRKTWRGRAELCLEERTAQWSRTRDARFLPTAWEYATIALGVPTSKRSPDQRRLLRAARGYYLMRGTI